MIITRDHARFVPTGDGIGYCSTGLRNFFKANGLDYDDFRQNGIPEEKLTALNDALADRLVETARRLTNGQ